MRALSIQSSFLGHTTFSEVLRASAVDAHGARLDSLWHDGAGGRARAINRVLAQTVPGHPNAGAWLFRAELGASLQARQQILRALRTNTYDALHLHTQGLGLAALDLMRRIPTVVSGDQTAWQIRQRAGGSGHRLNVAGDRRVFRRAAAIAMWSEHARRSVIEDFGCDPNRVVTIHPGVAPELLELKRSPGSGPPRLLFVGNDLRRKGGDQLVALMARGELGSARLDIVGNVDVPSDSAIVVHRGVEPRSERWLQLFSQADVFVAPARDEPYGLAVAEAQAAGLPVIATRIQALPEIVEDGVTGVLVAPGDDRALLLALRALLDEPGARNAMGERARARARKRFDPLRQTQRLIDLLADAAQRAATMAE